MFFRGVTKFFFSGGNNFLGRGKKIVVGVGINFWGGAQKKFLGGEICWEG